MTKIAIDARELRTSTGRYVERLIHYLQKIDAEHDYVILLKPKDMDSWTATNPRFTKMASPYKEFTFAEQIGFKKQLNELKANIVHFPAAQQPVWYKGPVVTTIQDLTTVRFRNPAKNPVIFKAKQWIYIWVNKRVAKKSLALLTPTEWVKYDVVDFTGVSPDKITATHEAADVFDEPPQPVPGFEGKRYVMSDGRPRSHKNTRRVIESFSLLHERYPDLHLMLTGKSDASFVPYQELIDSLGLHDWVVQTNFIPDGQLKWAMQHTQAYIWASLSEGFGLPPLEAMINGAPVASSNASCMPEVLGDAVHYFNPLDVEDMAAKIGELLDNPKLQRELIARGKLQIKKYSWQRMAEQTLAVYNKVLAEVPEK